MRNPNKPTYYRVIVGESVYMLKYSPVIWVVFEVYSFVLLVEI